MSSGLFRLVRASAIARLLLSLVLGTMLAACGGEVSQQLPPQQWQGMEVRVEPRPSPLHDGTSEFLVMVTDSRGKPAYNLIVSLRTSDSEPWKQAIEDGQVGVYRRGIKAEPGAVLQVQIKRNDTEGVLRFPLKP
jgi:hypothetical protein